MRPAFPLLILVATAAFAVASPRPQTVPIVDLSVAKMKTSATFGGVLGLRELSGGTVLINDAGRRQMWVYDTALTKARLVSDSTEGGSNSYGQIGLPLIPWLGDSSLMADISGGPRTVLVIDGAGQVARVMAGPGLHLVGAMAGVDDKGRIIYQVGSLIKGTPAGTVGTQEVYVDTIPVMRTDLDTRRDTIIGWVMENKGEFAQIDHMDPKKIIRTIFVNPLPAPDEWAVLTDGSVAFVRGHDYHIDWVRSDGTKSSTAKLPFDWKRLTDEDKQKLIDSAKTAHAAQNALAEASRNAPPPPPPPVDDGSGGRQRTGGGAGVTHAAYDLAGVLWVPLSYQVVDAKDMPDYYPAIRKGAAMADRDNHLWILPTTSAQSRKGELVYDVVNTKGDLFQRVRLPEGRQVAGFGKGGVVYMLSGDKKKGFYLERTRLPAMPH